jgi:hypothetical protein
MTGGAAIPKIPMQRDREGVEMRKEERIAKNEAKAAEKVARMAARVARMTDLIADPPRKRVRRKVSTYVGLVDML